MSALLEYRSVSRSFGQAHTEVPALHDVTFQVSAGELIIVMGPSGSGKSTLLLLGGALDLPTSGVVTLDGQSTSILTASEKARFRRQLVGYVFQQYNLLGQLTTLENVSLPMELDGISSRVARSEALTRLRDLGLDGYEDTFPENLSGGEQQRVAIARALVGQRRLLLADEPTGALDSVNGALVMQLIRNRCDQGAAAVITTHNPAHSHYADRLLLIEDGVIEPSNRRSGSGRPVNK